MSNPFMPTNAVPTNAVPTGAPMPKTAAPSSSFGDNFEIDLTAVQDSFTVPEGSYRVRVIDITQDVSKGGNPMFVWTFEISEGDHIGFQSKVFTALTPAAMWKVAETVQALGIGQTGSVVRFKRTDVLNKECGAIFETQDYNGQNRSQITKVISLKELEESKA